ncbi:hypothetical protein [Streptomyces thermoalcalitolerans]|uniref:Uncharacterized protein n=1 Tax=Streptomyces thermoalcalitolerans TaxID=65605 RepID=A0ABN1PCL1_9ACTN
MTTRTPPPQSNQSVIAFPEEIHWSGPPGGTAGGGEDGGADGSADGDPLSGLVRAVADDRPVEELVRLVALLEDRPEYTGAVRHALRTAALHRPVADVARLVAELTRPPRPADSADDAIRAAVMSRCVADVARLVALLHRIPQQAHCAREAVRAAATGRTVEDLVQLIGRLARERHDETYGEPCAARAAEAAGTVESAEAARTARTAETTQTTQTTQTTETTETTGAVKEQPVAGEPGKGAGRPVFWPGWVAAAALAVCGAAHFPTRWEGAPVPLCLLALAVSALCGALALVLALRTGVVALVTGAVLPAVLAAVGYVEGRLASAGLTRAVEITVAPPRSAGLTAVCASLACLAALTLLLMVQAAERHPPPRSVAPGSPGIDPPVP